MESQSIEYVAAGDTIADGALKDVASASLAATTSILLAILVIACFITNALLIATILSSYKLRNSILYIMICSAGFVNLVDTILVMFVSVMYIANTTWTFGDGLCRLNAIVQQYTFLKMLFLLVIMAMERTTSLMESWKVRITANHCIVFFFGFTIVAALFALPLAFNGFPVKSYRFRYLCAIGSYSALAYNIVEILVYIFTLIFLLCCFGYIFKKGNEPRSLPVKPQDYEGFIMETRTIQENLHLGKVVLFITLAYLLLQGPYIVMCFIVQIYNSKEILQKGKEYEIPQDADTLITWLRFFFPLVMPLIVLASCQDIWTKFVNLVCCRRSTMGSMGTWANNGHRPKSGAPIVPNNVLTLVATSEGLQLRVPEGNHLYQKQMQQQRQQEEMRKIKDTTMYGNVDHQIMTDSSNVSSIRSKTKNLTKKKKNGKKSAASRAAADQRWKY
uniref:G-protein coupled receptors family 1 profile domain-containing protein n=1 Tax=Panagrolaimus sp. PS1159 TaxID=55785 RepID=A0AC35ERX2_9BILA